MRKMIIATLFFSLFTSLAAPPAQSIVIIQSEAVNPYEKIWQAVCEVESNFDPLAYNPIEGACGISQIREVRLNDYNIRFKKKVPQIALFDVEISKSIFMAYMSEYNPDDIKGMAICWNGVSVKNKYYAKIQKALL